MQRGWFNSKAQCLVYNFMLKPYVRVCVIKEVNSLLVAVILSRAAICNLVHILMKLLHTVFP